MAIVEVTELEKTFNPESAEPIRVLEDLNLEVEEGEFVALMGPSGSGKTTLLNLIAGLDSPTHGSIRVGDQVISDMSESELAKWRTRNVGFVFQFYNLLPVLTAAENVELPLLLLPMSASERKERVRNALGIVDLADRMKHRPGKLSGGQCQRVGIARAIVTDPTIVVCDEPTGALDAKSADNALNLLEQLRTDLGKTIIMVTHDPHAAERAQRIIHLEKGRIVPGDAPVRKYQPSR
jgi:putative ABC transport system ATP-binding protein